MSTGRIQVFLLWLCLAATALAEDEGRLVTREYRPMPDEATYRIWEKDYFSGQEIWLAQSEVFWEDLARLPGLSREALVELLLAKRMPETLPERNFLLFRTGRERARYVMVPKTLKAGLRSDVLRAIYGLQIETYGTPPSKQFRDLADLKKWLLESKVDPKHIDRLLERNTAKANGWTHFVLSPDIGDLISDEVKKELRPYWRGVIRRVHKLSPGLEVFLEFGKDSDLAAIARKYAAGRDPAPIERLLRAHLTKSPEGVSMPLQEILPPHAKNQFGKFSVCDGPDCHDNGYKLVTEDRENLIDLRSQTEWAGILRREFRPVSANQKPRAGDLILYYGGGKLLHTAYYVTDDLVLTKNGRSRFAPQVFQARKVTDKLYGGSSVGGFVYLRYQGPQPSSACFDVPNAIGG